MGSDVEVTWEERRKAMQIMGWDPLPYDGLVRAVREGQNPDDRESLEMVDEIAQALADERAKVRAPFLALAEEIRVAHKGGQGALGRIADRIRRAAEEG